MSIHITLQPIAIQPTIPVGYHLATVKRWGFDQVMRDDNYTTVGRGDVHQFQIVSAYYLDATGRWVSTWSANSNYAVWRRTDMLRLANLQLLEHGYPWGMSEQEIMDVMYVLLDGWTLKQKLGWLIETTSGVPANPMWCANGNWFGEDVRNVGGVYGGQPIIVSNEVRNFATDYNGKAEYIPMRRILPFKAENWNDKLTNNPLIQDITVASYPTDGYSDHFRGSILMPTLFAGSDFAGNFVPVSTWIPTRWLV
jgi:hypothetical protein